MLRALLTRNSDVLLALFVVAIAIMLLIPLPTPLLDFLLAINISFSVLLLLIGLYLPNALALLAFPAILLLSTLFRLGLNVASARLILSDGDAGQVIESFGTFLIGGDIVVGVIIFVIITLVNFIVIARGSSRVSEVAARFALDALPGKQMAIDSDLRAGMVTPQEAAMRRDQLRKESQLYGAMDGAMKFVQGDAIAGFFIILTNIFGGFYQGVASGMSFIEARDTYVMLTIGDGLVSQVPALLISICAGIVVTRVSSGENTTLSADLGVQLFASPVVLTLTGFLVVCMAVVTQLWVPFLSVALILFGSAFLVGRRYSYGGVKLPALRGEPGGGPAGLIGMSEIEELLPDEQQLLILLDKNVLGREYQSNMPLYQVWWQDFKRDYYEAVGLRLPDLRVQDSADLATGSYIIRLGGTNVQSGHVPLDSVLVELHPESAASLGIEPAAAAVHPRTGTAVFWAVNTPRLKAIVDAAEIRVFDFMEYICLNAAVFAMRHPEEVLSITDVHSRLKQIEKRYPGLLNETLNTEFINVSRLTEILQELVREGINIKEFRQILEAIASYCSSYGHSMVAANDFDVQDIVSYIRINRRRHTLAGYLTERGTLKVVTLSEELESALEDVKIEGGAGTLEVDSAQFERIRSGLNTVFEPLTLRGVLPVSVLCRADLRHKVRRFMHDCNKLFGVVTFEELDPLVRIEKAGIWGL